MNIETQSFSFDRQRPTTKRHLDCSQNWTQIWNEIKTIKKEMKSKVARSQFMTSLGGKLSISELSSMTSLTSRKNDENVNNLNKSALSERMRSELEDLKSNFEMSLNARMEGVRKDIEELRGEINEIEAERGEEKSRNLQKIQDLREQVSQLQAYAYNKADRSQIQKLFTLNQLLVIQIQQGKQQSQQIHKQLKQLISINTKIQNNLTQASQQHKFHEQLHKITDNIKQEMKVFREEVDRVLDLVELRESETETYRAKENESFARCEADILYLKDKVKKVELESGLGMRDLHTRMNVVELKETQVSRAAQEVDGMRNQIQTIRMDLYTIVDKATILSEKTQQKCQELIEKNQQLTNESVERELQSTCEEIMKKVISITDSFVPCQDFREQITLLNQANQKVYEQSLKNSTKIDDLQEKLMQTQDSMEEDIEKNQERMNKVNKKMEEMVGYAKMREILENLVTCEEVTDIAKQIDQNVSKEMKKIVEEQKKVNEVLCSETIVAKWFWTSGMFKGGNLVTWDKQVVNTLPENFKWIQGQPSLIIATSGYYQIEFGFYSKKKPTVQLIVNGQTIVSAVNSNSYVIHHSSGKLKEIGNSEISGLTFVDYLLLPENARIAVSYIGEFSGQGFLSFKRV